MNTQVLKIDDEFAALIPSLNPDEYRRLEAECQILAQKDCVEKRRCIENIPLANPV